MARQGRKTGCDTGVTDSQHKTRNKEGSALRVGFSVQSGRLALVYENSPSPSADSHHRLISCFLPFARRRGACIRHRRTLYATGLVAAASKEAEGHGAPALWPSGSTYRL